MTMMRKNDELVALLREATARQEGFNRTALLRPLMDEIEAALASGMSRKAILGKLAQAGIDMPLATLDSILHRHRKRYGRKKAAPVSIAKAPPVAIVQAAPASSPSGKTVPQNTTDPASIPKTGIDRLNEIMRSTPDLAELARQAKATRKDRT